jgi:PAS domain S-box-containing protein
VHRKPLPRSWRQFLILPFVVWLVLTTGGITGMLWLQHRSRDGVAQRFQLRVTLMRDFVASYVADLMDRERVQAEAYLIDPAVSQRDFDRSVAAFGYPGALLVDGRGRVLRAVPADASVTGQDLTARYAHLRTAVRDGRPAVSGVVPSAVRRTPVVAFAMPFDTRSGRRVFSGAVAVDDSPLGAYLTSALPQRGAGVQLVDSAGAIVAANRTLGAGIPRLDKHDPELNRALHAAGDGRYRAGGEWWRYVSYPIDGTPWRLSATVPEDVLFASVTDNEIAGRIAGGTAAAVGLLVVLATARGRRNRRQSQLDEQRFRKVFDNSRIGMLISDPEGLLVRVNPAFCQMLGRPADELVGMHFADVTHPDDADLGLAALRDCLGGVVDDVELEMRYQHADGHLVEATVSSALVRDPAGQPQFFATQIVDVTERRALERARDRHEAELASRAEQLQQANTQMSDFIAMLTHDVRQPLTSVVANSELLLEEWGELDEPTKHHYLRRIAVAGHRADLLVSEILALAQLDAGALVAYPVRLDVAETVRTAVAAHGAAPDAPITVVAPDRTDAHADPAHLQLMLGNLLGNAIKYGAAPVTVTVTNAHEQVRILVSDQGEGVPPAFVPELFGRFTRARTGIAVAKPGTGLGLYLVRQLAEAGGITVDYQPNEPHGSTFVLTVPRGGRPATAAGEYRAPIAAPSGPG